MTKQSGFLRIALACVLFFSANLAAQAADKVTPHTRKLAADEKSPPATLTQMSWLTGHWVGEAFGGKVEEQWSAPEGGAMVGWYRLVKDGKPVFYEIITIAERDGSLVMRLKHFHADLKGWEEKDEVQEFRLVAIEDGVIHFEGTSFHPRGDTLTIYLAIGHKDRKPPSEQVFTYARR